MTRILAIGNNKYSTLFLSLQEWGYDVKIAGTIAESREILVSSKFDVVFLGLDIKDLSVSLYTVKGFHNALPIIGITALSESKTGHLLKENNIARSDFINIIRVPLSVEDLIFTIEESITQYPETVLTEEKKLSKKERQQRISVRRRELEGRRLSDFISSHLKRSIFEE